jgi:hypothetical protein
MTTDEHLGRRLRALAPDAGEGDWRDVKRRARRGVYVPLLAAAAAVAVAVGVAAPALGLHRTVLDWFSAEPAPERVQLEFARLGVGAPPGMAPGVIPNSARKVMEVRQDDKEHVLWVAPTAAGGFCYRWTGLFGGCRSERMPPPVRPRPRPTSDVEPFLLGVTWTSGGDGIATNIGGNVIAQKAERLVVDYADGAQTDVPVVWVSPPIDAGFFLFFVPEAHRVRGAQVTALTAVDADGEVVARQTFRLVRPEDVERPVELPDGNMVSLPPRADVERARKLFDFDAEDGTRVWLWVVPTKDGGRCWAFNRGGGCPPASYEQEIPMAAGLASGASPVLFNGQVTDEVVAVELRYEDGAVERLQPVEGFVLHEIGSAHYERGHRLETALALSADGEVLIRQPFRTDSPGVYPCEQPVDIGHGVRSCP